MFKTPFISLSLYKRYEMEKTITIKYPKSLANLLKLNEKDLEFEMKTSAIVKLYELGKISSNIRARVLGIDRVDFLELMARNNVSVLDKYDDQDLSEDIVNA